MSIRDRILLYIEYKSISKYRFYKDTGISNGFLDKGGAIGSDKCVSICSQYTDLNPEWLLLGTGSMLKETEKTKEFNTEQNPVLNENAAVKQLIDKIIELTAENENLKSKIFVLKKYNYKSGNTETMVAETKSRYTKKQN